MPNPKKVLSALELAFSKLPQGSAEAQRLARLEAEFEAAKKAEAYAPHTLPTSSGNAALNQARQTLQSAPKDSGVVDLNDVINHHIERHAKGGGVHMAVGGDLVKAAIEEGLALAKKVASGSSAAYKAADRAKAGNEAARMIKSQPKVKASEALGQLMEQGHKKVSTTQSDRTRVGKGNIGGAQFPAISQVDPAYAGKVWGVMDEGTASRLINLSDADTLWTTMLGSEHQLKSNPIVFDKLRKQFFDALKQGKF